MAVNLVEKKADECLPIDGVKLFVGQANIQRTAQDDLLLVVLPNHCTVGAVFTQNRFCAAPVHVASKHLFNENGIRALIINTGNANAGTGASGRAHCLQICQAVAKQLNCQAEQVLPFSTGVILQPLPFEKIIATLPKMRPADWQTASRAIMTQDTIAKISSRQSLIGSHHTVKATGIAKGTSLIHPNMATMLGFIATDANIAQPILQLLTQEVADATFNNITIDGDTSTNDSFVIMATGKSGQSEIDNIADPRYQQIKILLTEVALELAQAIVRDGKGAKKFLTIHVSHADNADDAKTIAYAIAHSNAVKHAFFTHQAHLGALLMAIGKSNIPLDINVLELYVNNVLIVQQGERAPSYTEADGQLLMQQTEITIWVKLNMGKAQAKIYTCDSLHAHQRPVES